MNILFTGHRGFLGREVIPHLLKTHDVFYPDIDYANKESVQIFVKKNNIDFILHAAIKGGRRVRQDIPDDFYVNMKMFENLAAQKIPMINFCSGAAFGRQKDIYLAEENQVGEIIPEDYYGFAKSLITQRCRQLDNVYNLRFFNVFGPEDVNLVYETKTKLSDVARIINNLSEYEVPVSVLEEGMDKSYCGSGELLKTFGIEFAGLENEIENCYEHFCKRNF